MIEYKRKIKKGRTRISKEEKGVEESVKKSIYKEK
jgi:hypothetical protein